VREFRVNAKELQTDLETRGAGDLADKRTLASRKWKNFADFENEVIKSAGRVSWTDCLKAPCIPTRFAAD